MSNAKIIKPTNGRIVWFTPGSDFQGAHHDICQPLPAMICHVWSDHTVNLVVTDSDGIQWPVTSVELIHHDADKKLYAGHYCEWMPYQIGQAAKTEELTKAVAEINGSPARNEQDEIGGPDLGPFLGKSGPDPKFRQVLLGNCQVVNPNTGEVYFGTATVTDMMPVPRSPYTDPVRGFDTAADPC